jgi:hypothetical protein
MGERAKKTEESLVEITVLEQAPGQDEQTGRQSLEAISDDLLIKDHEVGGDLDSLEARVGYGSLLRELQHAYIERVAFYRSKVGGALGLEEARAAASHACKDEEEAKEIYQKMMSVPLDRIDFVDMAEMWSVAPQLAEEIWEGLKSEAGDKFESGHQATEAMYPVQHMRTAWNVASYLGLRESFIAEWQPRGGIELSLIDMLAQAFLMYQHWMKESVLLTQTRVREVHPEYEKWQQAKEPKANYRSGFLDGYWFRPFVHEQAAVEHAAQMADRWNRIYMRTLRNMRDLRRYSVPVTINNPQQVNIATDGGQQVNVKREG